MLLATWFCAVLTVAAEAGRVEVEGLVVTAAAKPSAFNMHRSGGGQEIEIELSIETKAGGAMPICQFVGPIKAIGADHRTLSSPSRFGFDTPPPRPTGANRWSINLYFEEAPSKKLHALEGTLSIAPSQWKTVMFEGASLKPNSIVKLETGQVKLTVLDLEDGPADVRFRMTQMSTAPRSTPITGAKLTITDAKGKESVLSSQGHGSRSGGGTVDHSLRFHGGKTSVAGPLRTLRLDVPTPTESAKKVAFRVLDVPVVEGRETRKGK